MEKITKEELQEELFCAQMSDDEQKDISGGVSNLECLDKCKGYSSLTLVFCMQRCSSD